LRKIKLEGSDILYVIYSKQDVPQLYTSEASEYALLSLSARSISGSGSFTSTSSAVIYNYTSGLQDLYNQLYTVLQPYTIVALEWNAIRSWLWGNGVPIESGYRQLATYDSNSNVTNFAIYTSSAQTTKVAELIVAYDSNNNVTSTREKYYDSNGTTVLCDYTDTITYDSSGNFSYSDRTVTV